MLKSGEFKAVSKYKLSFISRAKKRGKAVTSEIFCLVEAATFINAFSWLQRSSITVNVQLRDMIADVEQWGEGSHADRLERIIARAHKVDKLERQLAREYEKRQAARV